MNAIAEPELPATFTFAEAEDRGLSRRRLQRLQATGAVERIGRGLYRRASRVLRDDRPHSGGDGGRVYRVSRVDLKKRSKSSGSEMVLVPQLFDRAF